MLDRKVLIGSKTYSAHVITGISVLDGSKSISVCSYIDSSDIGKPMADFINRSFSMECDTADEYAAAYSYISGLAEFSEYIDPLDEVLPILTDEQAEQVIDAFPEWAVGVAYQAGYRVRYSGNLYRCLQGHTSAEGWEPSVAVSLWARIGEPGEIPEWEQPGSTNPYMKGDQVRHVGKVWESLVDNNVWEPGTPGTETLWREI